MEQPVFPNDLRIRVAEHCEVAVCDIVPHLAGMRQVVNADCDYMRILGVKIALPLRELAQLLDAERSPVSAIEIENNLVASLRC